jgi:hypothetical protein
MQEWIMVSADVPALPSSVIVLMAHLGWRWLINQLVCRRQNNLVFELVAQDGHEEKATLHFEGY